MGSLECTGAIVRTGCLNHVSANYMMVSLSSAVSVSVIIKALALVYDVIILDFGWQHGDKVGRKKVQGLSLSWGD